MGLVAVKEWLSAIAERFPLEQEVLTPLLLLLLGWVIHGLLGWLFRHLHKAAQASARVWDDILLSAVQRPARVGLWVLVVYLILRTLSLAPTLESLIARTYETLLIALLAWFLHRLIAGIEAEMLSPSRAGASSADRATVRATSKLARIALWIMLGLMVLQSAGVSVQGLLAFGGIGGIAVGFAAKDLLANFFGGLSIYLDRPFTVGDWIRSPDKQIEGTVEQIGWRLTVIRTFDQRPLYVPNAVFSQIAVENPSRMFNRRIYETIGLRYADGDKVAAIVSDVRQMLTEHEAIDKNRTLIVNFVAFGSSSLDFFIYAFTRTTVWVEYHQIKEDVLLAILGIIHDHGADIAFPTQTLQLEKINVEPGT